MATNETTAAADKPVAAKKPAAPKTVAAKKSAVAKKPAAPKTVAAKKPAVATNKPVAPNTVTPTNVTPTSAKNLGLLSSIGAFFKKLLG